MQHLHMDMGDYLNDATGKLNYLDMPTSRIQVNYPMTVRTNTPTQEDRQNASMKGKKKERKTEMQK
jgi:hypothetical protein